MKRTLVSLLSLLALFTIISCQKDATGDGSQFRATMEPTADGKTVLSGTALNWVSGDRVAIYGTAGCGIYQATPQTPATVATLNNVEGSAGDGPFHAFYPASLTDDGTTITLPSAQTYVENSINEFPMYAESATNQLAFKNLCGVLKLHLTKANTDISSITVKANAQVCGDFTVSYVNDIPYLSYVQGGSNTVTMTCATAQDITGGKDFYIALPATFDSLKSIELNTADGRYCVKTVKSNVRINVQRSTVTEIEFDGSDMEFRPIGSKGGLFTINQDGDQIWFSQGNLKYQASTQTWSFAENQWDYVGSDNDNISATYSGWIDIFGWGTGNNPTFNSHDRNDYITFVDWGTNAISNGGDIPNVWRTLSRTQWDYILNNRSNALSKRGSSTMNGVHGLVILPDNWVIPAGIPDFVSSLNNWTDNVYTISQWAEMESNGAVFLPAAGAHYGGGAWGWERFGVYWSSTNDGNGYAYAADLQSNVNGSPSDWGFSVRLVRDNN